MKKTKRDFIKSYDFIYLIDKGINPNSLISKIKIKKKTLLIYLGNINKLELKKNYFPKNIDFIEFSWSLFNDLYDQRWKFEQETINFSKKRLKILKTSNILTFNLLKKLYASDQILIAFEKCIINKTRNFFEIKKIFELIFKVNPNISVFINDYNQRDINVEYKNFTKKLIIINSKKKHNLIKNFLIMILFPLISTLSIRKINLQKKDISYALRTYKKSPKLNNFQFLNNCLIVFEETPTRDQINFVKKNNYLYHYASYKNPLQKTSISFIIKLFILYIPFGIILAFTLPFCKFELRNEFTKSWLRFLIWSNFVSLYNIKAYLSYHNYNEDHIYRNIILKQFNCTTALFKHTHSENVYDYSKKKKYSNSLFYKLMYDLEFHWSKSSVEMSKKNYSKSRKFLITGPFWSSKYFQNKTINNSKKQKIISFFPSTLNSPIAVNGPESHVNFLRLIKKVMKKYKDYLIFFKTKSQEKNYIENSLTKKIFLDLKKNKRFRVIKDSRQAYEIYNISNLSISMPFSSCSLEAICSGKKSFYYNCMNIYPNSYFKRFKDFVVNNENKAMKNISVWLKLNKSQFNKKKKDYFKILKLDNEPSLSIDFMIKEIEKNS